MKNRFTSMLMQFLLLLFVSTAASAQSYYPVPVQRVFSQQELDQMLAPIALYPDPLLSQILMAATYPPEVAQAAEWSRSNPHLRGDPAVRAVSGFYWEPSVKSMVAFPEILSVMAARMDWTTRLGDAFLSQQQQVMDTIQYLRRKALASGTLRSDERIRVVVQGGVIMIEPAVQREIYVPYYNPTVVYGTWWWPNYSPVYWDPWPGYYYHQPYAYGGGLAWGAGIPVGVGLFFGYFDWSHRHVYVKPHRRWDYWHDHKRQHEWRHNPEHRHGTPYRDESVRRRYDTRKDGRDRRGAGTQEDRRDMRGHTSVRGRDTGARTPSTQTSVGTRPTATAPAAKSTAPAAVTPTTPRAGVTAARQQSKPPVGRTVRTDSRPSAFEGVDRGGEERGYGARGRSSKREAGNGSRAASSRSGNGDSRSARPSPRSSSGSSSGSDRSAKSGSGANRKD